MKAFKFLTSNPLPSEREVVRFIKSNYTHKKEVDNNVANILNHRILRADKNAEWECCGCRWVGKHSDSADKTPVVNDFWLLACPRCGNNEKFYACG